MTRLGCYASHPSLKWLHRLRVIPQVRELVEPQRARLLRSPRLGKSVTSVTSVTPQVRVSAERLRARLLRLHTGAPSRKSVTSVTAVTPQVRTHVDQ
jgi:hypothetical protein